MLKTCSDITVCCALPRVEVKVKGRSQYQRSTKDECDEGTLEQRMTITVAVRGLCLCVCILGALKILLVISLYRFLICRH